MVKSRHRSSIKRYIGISHQMERQVAGVGCTYNFDVYSGKSQDKKVGKNGLAYDVVMNRTKPLLGQGHHLFVDNFYTSVALVRDLFAKRVMTTGTKIKNRVGSPSA